ncbi:MAG: LLM class F420-dependent oxidoreductase [Pseudomonadales bacterium]|nr:LLM class F420-dependent oxidoreductase [Pseudomonadales bacterium]MCP5185122.1 LLM class F420-dependent oxidoreductase [Pseudomonadales bacterium]
MKLSVEFPGVAYREGPEGVKRLARAIEDIGYDHIDMFDHVIMGYPTDTRAAPMYPPKMPIMEAMVMLSYIAAVTSRVTLGTEVLVLPQRQPTLVAKQVSTLDTLSGGRMRLGVGVGWQASEYEALGENFNDRGRRMDEAIRMLRAWFSDERVDFNGHYYQAVAMAMEPKSPQGANLPIWVGGASPAALRRTAELADGWLATAHPDDNWTRRALATLRANAEAIGRDPATLGLQSMLDVPPRDEAGKRFYNDDDNVVRRAEQVHAMGFQWGALNATAIFQAGFRSLDALIDKLGSLHNRLRAALG